MNESKNGTRRIRYDYFSNEERDCYRRLRWNRKLDRKTTGKRRIFGGRELRGKTGSRRSSCRRYHGCREQGIALHADVANAEDVERLFKESMDAFGRPDVVVHCAGIMRQQVPRSRLNCARQVE